ncbi:MAG: SDR family oxidoreductase, partial [Chloroflexi bacterium]|nr:SDR family oxidoreductase [Chloroflexota bacterium]
MFDFTGESVIITGATGNLGRAVTQAFADAGAMLALLGRNEARLQAVVDEVGLPAGRYLVQTLDVINSVKATEAINHVIAQCGRVDVLVNAAGGYRAGQPLHEMPLDAWDFMLNLNARSVFVMSHAVVPCMLSQGRGKIISVAARAALQPNKQNMSAYRASKAAVISLTESLSAELRSANINVNCILPGTIDTPENRKTMPDANYANWVPPAKVA